MMLTNENGAKLGCENGKGVMDRINIIGNGLESSMTMDNC